MAAIPQTNDRRRAEERQARAAKRSASTRRNAVFIEVLQTLPLFLSGVRRGFLLGFFLLFFSHCHVLWVVAVSAIGEISSSN